MKYIKHYVDIIAIGILCSTSCHRDDMGRRFVATTNRDLKTLRGKIQCEIETGNPENSGTLFRSVPTGSGVSLRRVVLDCKLDIDPDKYRWNDENLNEYMIGKIDGAIVIWSFGLNKIDEAGKGDDIVYPIDSNTAQKW